jgi:sulfur-carrier protein
MRVTVLVPRMLRDDVGGTARLELDVEAAGTARLADALDVVGACHPRLERRLRDERRALRRYVNIYVDGEECRHLGGTDAPVRDGAEIQIIPSVAGG